MTGRLTDEQIIAMLGAAAEEGPLLGADPPLRCWDVTEQDAIFFARAIEAAVLAANPQVPREPTPEMANAGSEYSGLPSMTWRAMYDAAPPPPPLQESPYSAPQMVGAAPEQPQEPRADVADVLRRIKSAQEDSQIRHYCYDYELLEDAAALIREQRTRIRELESWRQAVHDRAERAEAERDERDRMIANLKEGIATLTEASVKIVGERDAATEAHRICEEHIRYLQPKCDAAIELLRDLIAANPRYNGSFRLQARIDAAIAQRKP